MAAMRLPMKTTSNAKATSTAHTVYLYSALFSACTSAGKGAMSAKDQVNDNM
eukprot:CAMPEP_0180821032 /NCGR_PEP_ID=MMETSP1038_2-20121128/70618_1 /TAXON_ID=632150 /ORGANISM="Azadinium spinosum, Strain 3D9" /LENGTH=51 /DNA_ID=CAMNT_0022863195 /DNA_START=872 /DNA_END=1024 /DNA_ORIENTATION=-